MQQYYWEWICIIIASGCYILWAVLCCNLDHFAFIFVFNWLCHFAVTKFQSNLLPFFRQLQMAPAHSSYNIVSLCDKVRASESAVSFLKDYGVLNNSATCTKCLSELTDVHRKPGTAYWYYPCSTCNTMVSIRSNTILSHGKIGMRTFILMAYTFIMCQGLTLAQKIHEVSLILIFLFFSHWCTIFVSLFWYLVFHNNSD